MNFSETYHLIISIFFQRKPLKLRLSLLIYAVIIYFISQLSQDRGLPTYILHTLVFLLLLLGHMIELGKLQEHRLSSVIIYATLPLINLQLEGYIEDFLLSVLPIDPIEMDFFISYLLPFIILVILTRCEVKLLDYLKAHLKIFDAASITFFLSFFFFYIISDITTSMAMLFEINELQAEIVSLPFLILPLMYILSVLFLNNALNKSQEVAREKEQFKVSQAFSSMMADQYQEMRKFRHDYKNILLTLEGYIRDQEWQGLADYFHQHIQPTQVMTDQLGLELSRLSKIQSPDVRNLLFTKLAFAGTNGIDLSIEVPDDIHLNVERNPIYLVRIIGILLDNAIEALSNQEGGKLTLAVFEDDGDVHLIIENDCQEDPGDLNKLLEAGYSTKGSGRGLGLSNALELARESQFQLTTQFANERFTQHLLIRKELLVP